MFDHIRNTTTEETWKSILKDLSDKKTHLEVGFGEKSSLGWSPTVQKLIANQWLDKYSHFPDKPCSEFSAISWRLETSIGTRRKCGFSRLDYPKFFKLKISKIPKYSNRSQTKFLIDKKDFLQILAIVIILGEFSWSPIHSKRVLLMSRFIFETLYFKLKSFIHLNSFLVFFFTSKIITSLPSTVKFAFMKFHQNMHKRNVISRRTSTGSFSYVPCIDTNRISFISMISYHICMTWENHKTEPNFLERQSIKNDKYPKVQSKVKSWRCSSKINPNNWAKYYIFWFVKINSLQMEFELSIFHSLGK